MPSVTFTTDWREDAMRRDFTMNALYCDAEGRVHDPLGGYGDLKTKRVRFIGDARQRIREDFLRILRFFRFWRPVRRRRRTPDAEGLAAAAAEKAGLAQLSGERIRAELLLLLAAPAVVPALKSMSETGIVEPLLGVRRRHRTGRASGSNRGDVAARTRSAAAAGGARFRHTRGSR